MRLGCSGLKEISSSGRGKRLARPFSVEISEESSTEGKPEEACRGGGAGRQVRKRKRKRQVGPSEALWRFWVGGGAAGSRYLTADRCSGLPLLLLLLALPVQRLPRSDPERFGRNLQEKEQLGNETMPI